MSDTITFFRDLGLRISDHFRSRGQRIEDMRHRLALLQRVLEEEPHVKISPDNTQAVAIAHDLGLSVEVMIDDREPVAVVRGDHLEEFLQRIDPKTWSPDAAVGDA